MSICFIAEHYDIKGKTEFSEEIEEMIDWFANKNSEVAVINPLNYKIQEDHISGYNPAKNKKIMLNFKDISSLCFLTTSQKFYQQSIDNALTNNLGQICELIESLPKNGSSIRSVNPIESILWGLSKHYFIELQSLGLPFIESKDIRNLEELLELSKSDKIWLAKPKIAERGNGIVILNGQSEEFLSQYYQKYMKSNASAKTLYEKVMQRQGIIAQEFNEDFKKYGEKKLFVIKGEVVLARRTYPLDPTSFGNNLVIYGKGTETEKYEPSAVEKKLAAKVFEMISKIQAVEYMRVDITGDKISYDSLKINEIEVINPCSATSSMDGFYTMKEVTNFYEKLYLVLKKGVEN